MKISYYTVRDNLDTTRGYGAAGFNVVTSLQKLGHEVQFDDKTAPVQIAFCQPTWYKFHKDQYRIGYTPWESTVLPDGWARHMNRCDEVWATSEWVANVFEMQGVRKPIKVYEHGIDSKWAPIKREKREDGVTRFLHMGEPALRKGGQLAVEAFREKFGSREDVHLTIKAYHTHYLRIWKNGNIYTPDKLNNVTVIDEMLHPSELMGLYADHDCMLYPSYGEGFGFIPLQALATGLPTICTDDWAAYKKYLGPLALKGRYDRSIWALHPGDVYYPDFNMLKDLMGFVHKEPGWLHDYYYNQAKDIHTEFDWVSKTSSAWQHIFDMFD